MAIDTAAKRRAAGGVAFLPLGPGVTPDAAKPNTWRQQAAWSYSGISLLVINPEVVPRQVLRARGFSGRIQRARSFRGRVLRSR